jgi:hypothetical protein
MVWIIFLFIIVGVWLAFGRKAAGKTILITLTLVFVGFAGLIVWVLNAYPSPSTPSSNFQNPYSAIGHSDTAPATQTTINQVTAPVVSTGVLPTMVGQCDSTTVTQIGTRLTDGSTGNPIPGTGSAIWYADGGYQVSYDTIQGVSNSQVGDRTNLCLVSIPANCPPGDNRGRVYQATNLRTNESWEASDAEHSCGGA